MFDDSAITAAVTETLGLIIEAIGQTQFYREKKIAYHEIPDIVNIFGENILTAQSELASDFDCLLQESRWNIDGDIIRNGHWDEKEISQNGEISKIESGIDDTILLENENDGLESYWRRVCQDDDLDYQDDCVATKNWLKNEITSLEIRSKNRAKYVVQAHKENSITKIQAMWRSFHCKKQFYILQTSLRCIRRWLGRCVARRKYFSKLNKNNRTNALVAAAVTNAFESIFDFYVLFHLTTSFEEMRNEASSSFSMKTMMFSQQNDNPSSKTEIITSEMYRFFLVGAFVPWQFRNSEPQLLNTFGGEMHGKSRKSSINLCKIFRGKVVGAAKTKSSLRSKFSFDFSMPCRSPLMESAGNAAVCISGDTNTLGLSYSDFSVESLNDNFFLSNSSICGETLVANVNKVHSLSSFFGISNLKTLSLSDNNISSCEELSSFASLRHANLESNKIENDVNLSLPNLMSLSLNCNKIQSFTARKVLSLRRLSLYSNCISSFDLAGDHTLSTLIYLNLGRNRLETINWSAISHLHFLSTLILSQNCLHEFPSKLSLPFLQSLWLNGNRICGVLQNRKQALSFPMLKRLYLQDNKIKSIQKKFALTCPNLTELDISFNEISTPAILRFLCVFQQLKLLRLSDNPLVASSGRNEKLESFVRDVQFCTGNGNFRFIKWPCIGNWKRQHVQHESYCMRSALELFHMKRKRLFSEIRQNGGKFADIEVATFCDDVYFQCAKMLINSPGHQLPDEHSYRPSSVALAVASSSMRRASLKLTPKIVEKQILQNSEEIQAHTTIISPPAEVAIATVTETKCIGSRSELDRLPFRDQNEQVCTSNCHVHENAIKTLQRFFLASRNKKLIKAVLETVRYKDDEVDKLLSEDLEMDWLENYCDDEVQGSSTIDDKIESYNQSSTEVVASPALAYGDHIRKRNLHLDMNEIHRLNSEEVKILTSKSAPAHNEKAVKGNTANEIRDEWGIQNDCLLSTMLKRQKKLRKRKEKDVSRRK